MSWCRVEVEAQYLVATKSQTYNAEEGAISLLTSDLRIQDACILGDILGWHVR